MNFTPPPRPRLDLGAIPPSEEAFFGVDHIDDQLSHPEAPKGVANKITAFAIALSDKRSERRRETEIEEIFVERDPQAMYWDGPLDPSLEQHMIRLSSNRSWEEFLAAEQQESLFEQYERTINRHERVTVASMWITAIAMTVLAVMYGQDYLASVVKDDMMSSFVAQFVTDAAQVHDITMVLALIAPLALFATTFQAVNMLILGVLGRGMGRASIAATGVLAAFVIVLLMGAGMFPAAIGCAIGASLAMRVCARVMTAVGAR